MSSRGGKGGGKGIKPKRGGGKKFSRNLLPLDDGGGNDLWGIPRDPAPEVGSGSEEEETEEEGGPSTENVTLSREERRAAARARKEAARKSKAAADDGDDDDDEDEDDTPKSISEGSRKGLAPGNPNSEQNVGSGELTRREREEREKAAAKEKYMKLHLAGKTDEAKADLARLAIIKKEREEKARQRQVELEAKKAATEAKLAASGRKK